MTLNLGWLGLDLLQHWIYEESMCKHSDLNVIGWDCMFYMRSTSLKNIQNEDIVPLFARHLFVVYYTTRRYHPTLWLCFVDRLLHCYYTRCNLKNMDSNCLKFRVNLWFNIVLMPHSDMDSYIFIDNPQNWSHVQSLDQKFKLLG